MLITRSHLYAASAIAAAFFATAQFGKTYAPAPLQAASGNASFVTYVGEKDSVLPAILSKKDRALYLDIFRAQKKSDWDAATTATAQISDKLLMGHVLAERYLNRHYNSTPTELAAWLADYPNYPQARDIYALAITKTPGLAGEIPAPRKQSTLGGYGDDNGLAASFGNSKHAATWHKALTAWRTNHKADAAKLFSGLLKDDDLPRWKASAAAFWAYRSYDAVGNKGDARKYLAMAAEEPRSFYGILARKTLKQPLGLDNKPEALTSSAASEIANDPAVRRIMALAEVNRGELAEKELRAMFPDVDAAKKLQLLSLAHELNLASVQIAMAKQLGREDGRMLDYARYPIPHWQPQNGFKVDPALIYALVRQESGFHASAVSPDGALGLMQLMPQTANLMKKSMGSDILDSKLSQLAANDSDPMFNMALGQNYVQHLLENDLVEGNLFYMLTAYNAGPGRLSEWKDSIAAKNDPLFFVESIPFAETRNYVMQVMTNYWIYSELAGNPSSSIYALLSGHWPQYNVQQVPVASGSIQAIIDNAG
jgi:soluble lytic murein transglycosylase